MTSINVSDPISDHCFVAVELNIQLPTTENYTRTVPNYRNTDWEGLRCELHCCSLLEAIQGTTDVNIAWTVWSSLVCDAVKRHVPTRTVLSSHSQKPWLSGATRTILRKKHRLFKLVKRKSTTDNWTAYKKQRNICTSAIRKAKSDHMNRQFRRLSDEADGSHRWWGGHCQVDGEDFEAITGPDP